MFIIVDAYSKYPEVFEMHSTTSMSTIAKMRYLFTRHGIPELLVTDNGTQFQSNQFQRFTKSNGIQHLFSAPYCPQSNGQAERFVDIFKRAFTKIKGEGVTKDIIETFLVTYRTTPCETLGGKCPAELFIGRRPRTTLDLLKPPATNKIIQDHKMEAQYN